METDAFDACLSCGLLRAEVTAARCRVAADRLGFDLNLVCSVDAVRAAQLARQVFELNPAVLTLIVSSVHGSWSWDGNSTLRAARRSSEGVEFHAVLREPLDDERADLWERCLRAFGLSLVEEWMARPGSSRHPGPELRPLRGVAQIRHRPGMYIQVSGAGRRPSASHLVDAVLRDAATGWLDGSTRRIEVVVLDDGRISVTDDGMPFAFEPVGQGENLYSRLGSGFVGPGWSRGPGDQVRRLLSWPTPLVASALSVSCSVAASREGQAREERFAYGRSLGEPTPCVGWGSDGTRVTFLPDTNLVAPITNDEVVRIASTLAALHPGGVIFVNGEPCSLGARNRSDIMRRARGQRLFERTLQFEGARVHCLLGLSHLGGGGLEVVLNLEILGKYREEQRDAVVAPLLAALEEAVALPVPAGSASMGDLVGRFSLEVLEGALQDSGRFGGPFLLRQGLAVEIQRELSAVLASFLDESPGAREELAARWRPD